MTFNVTNIIIVIWQVSEVRTHKIQFLTNRFVHICRKQPLQNKNAKSELCCYKTTISSSIFTTNRLCQFIFLTCRVQKPVESNAIQLCIKVELKIKWVCKIQKMFRVHTGSVLTVAASKVAINLAFGYLSAPMAIATKASKTTSLASFMQRIV